MYYRFILDELLMFLIASINMRFDMRFDMLFICYAPQNGSRYY